MVRVEGDGWQEALDLYKSQADDLHAGREPRVSAGGLTLVELCNAFLELTDPVEQRARFVRDQEQREARGNPVYPIDAEFLGALGR